MSISGVLLAVVGGFAAACVGLAILAVGLNLIFALGYTVGPLAGGWLLARSGAEIAYALIAPVSALVAILLVVPLLRQRKS